MRSILRYLAFGTGAAVGAYAAYVSATWLRYGNPPRPGSDEEDPLLDRFLPQYDIVERHHVRVNAPAEVTLSAACRTSLSQSPIVRGIFRAREILLGAARDERPHPRGLLDEVRALGWAVLHEVPGREIVVGAVTKPWEPNVTFRAIAPDEFASFAEPDYVKIAWTLRADPAGDAKSVFRTETRAVSTDAGARIKFRRYWSLLSPGIILIRWLLLGPVRAEAERVVVSIPEDSPAGTRFSGSANVG